MSALEAVSAHLEAVSVSGIDFVSVFIQYISVLERDTVPDCHCANAS